MQMREDILFIKYTDDKKKNIKHRPPPFNEPHLFQIYEFH